MTTTSFALTIAETLEVSNATEVITAVAAIDKPDEIGLYVRRGTRIDQPGSYEVKLISAYAPTLPNPLEWSLAATADYWLTLWAQAKDDQARLARSGDPDDIHGDDVMLYNVVEDISDGLPQV